LTNLPVIDEHLFFVFIVNWCVLSSFFNKAFMYVCMYQFVTVWHHCSNSDVKVSANRCQIDLSKAVDFHDTSKVIQTLVSR